MPRNVKKRGKGTYHIKKLYRRNPTNAMMNQYRMVRSERKEERQRIQRLAAIYPGYLQGGFQPWELAGKRNPGSRPYLELIRNDPDPNMEGDDTTDDIASRQIGYDEGELSDLTERFERMRAVVAARQQQAMDREDDWDRPLRTEFNTTARDSLLGIPGDRPSARAIEGFDEFRLSYSNPYMHQATQIALQGTPAFHAASMDQQSIFYHPAVESRLNAARRNLFNETRYFHDVPMSFAADGEINEPSIDVEQ